jgi:superfamily I DNA and/or RNA helicase
VQGREEFTNGRSIRNTDEVSAVVDIVQKCRQIVGATAEGGKKKKKKPSIGVICFFRAQAYAIKTALEKLPPISITTTEGPSNTSTTATDDGTDIIDIADDGIQVATVDSFQGEEKDIIILSTAITKPGAFITDACRLNVALTRARHNIIVVGHTAALTQASPALGALFKECRSKPGGFWPQGRLVLKKGVDVEERKVNNGDEGDAQEMEKEQATEKKKEAEGEDSKDNDDDEEDLPNFDLI